MTDMEKDPDRTFTKDFYPVAALALVLFIPMFVSRQLMFLDFWWWMSTNLVIVCTLSLAHDKGLRREMAGDLPRQAGYKILVGIASAALLYLVFRAGNFLSREMFEFAGRDIGRVYGFKDGAGAMRIALLMLFIIGPGEELFWRGFVQGNLSAQKGKIPGFWLGVLFYTLIHVATGNVILILAAFTGGLFWGWLYMRYRSLLVNMVSHIVWDISVFLLLPFSG